MSTSSKLGPAGHLPARMAQPRELAGPSQQPNASHRAQELTSTLPGSCQAAAIGSSALVLLRSLLPARQKNPSRCLTGLPQQSYSCEQDPLCVICIMFWQTVPGKKQLTPGRCGNMDFNTSAWSTPVLYHMYTARYNLLCTRGSSKGWKTSGSRVAGMHLEIPGSHRLLVAAGTRQMVCPHTGGRKLWFIA